MRYRYLLWSILTIILPACKKEMGTTTKSPSHDPPVPVMLLKSMEIPNLPSPYYLFEYDTAGRIAFASFASGLNAYKVRYNASRITEMVNDNGANKGLLQYFYDNENKISFVNYIDPAGTLQMRFSFTYDKGKLIRIERERKAGMSLILNKTIVFSYYPDGNLLETVYHYPFIANLQTESTFTKRFEQYDDKINVDDFDLLHNDFFDQLILLPGVKLQKNNPGREIETGDGDNSTSTYTYTYNDKKFPLVKAGEVTFTNGIHAGEMFQTNVIYTYY